jgi:hypothetical protein
MAGEMTLLLPIAPVPSHKPPVSARHHDPLFGGLGQVARADRWNPLKVGLWLRSQLHTLGTGVE